MDAVKRCRRARDHIRDLIIKAKGPKDGERTYNDAMALLTSSRFQNNLIRAGKFALAATLAAGAGWGMHSMYQSNGPSMYQSYGPSMYQAYKQTPTSPLLLSQGTEDKSAVELGHNAYYNEVVKGLIRGDPRFTKGNHTRVIPTSQHPVALSQHPVALSGQINGTGPVEPASLTNWMSDATLGLFGIMGARGRGG
jgi:hypothetical protein